MSEKQKKVLSTLKEILPKMSDESQSYLLGYGEGIAEALKNTKKNLGIRVCEQEGGERNGITNCIN